LAVISQEPHHALAEQNFFSSNALSGRWTLDDEAAVGEAVEWKR
jgi:hypothetical protein